MALFSDTFSFAAPSSRPSYLYTYGTAADSISPTSSRAGSPSSPTTPSAYSTASSSNPSCDDLFALTSHLSSSSLYPTHLAMSGRRSPPRSNPFGLPPCCVQASALASSDLPARRERRQAFAQEQLSCASRRKLSLLVARVLSDEAGSSSGRSASRLHEGLHPSNVRVVPAVPASGARSRRNTLAELKRSDDEASSEEDVGMHGEAALIESIESDLPIRSRQGSSANRVSKRGSGGGRSARRSGVRGKK